MLELLNVNPSSGDPIYRQLSEQIIHLIVGGQLPEETVLPSVRQMAEHLAVNPMTVSRAVQQLGEQGWRERRRGQATRVALRQAHQSLSAEAIITPQLEDLLVTAQQLGLSQQGLQQLVVKYWPQTKE